MQSCFCPVLKIDGRTCLEENLALIQTIFGENSRAISTLTRLLQTPYMSWVYARRLLRRPFLGSIRSGTLCAPIPLSKNSARKSSLILEGFSRFA